MQPQVLFRSLASPKYIKTSRYLSKAEDKLPCSLLTERELTGCAIRPLPVSFSLLVLEIRPRASLITTSVLPRATPQALILKTISYGAFNVFCWYSLLPFLSSRQK